MNLYGKNPTQMIVNHLPKMWTMHIMILTKTIYRKLRMLFRLLTCTSKEHSVEGSGYLFLVFSTHKASEQRSQTPAKRYIQTEVLY